MPSISPSVSHVSSAARRVLPPPRFGGGDTLLDPSPPSPASLATLQKQLMMGRLSPEHLAMWGKVRGLSDALERETRLQREALAEVGLTLIYDYPAVARHLERLDDELGKGLKSRLKRNRRGITPAAWLRIFEQAPLPRQITDDVRPDALTFPLDLGRNLSEYPQLERHLPEAFRERLKNYLSLQDALRQVPWQQAKTRLALDAFESSIGRVLDGKLRRVNDADTLNAFEASFRNTLLDVAPSQPTRTPTSPEAGVALPEPWRQAIRTRRRIILSNTGDDA